MKKKRYIRIFFIIVVVGFALMGTLEEVWAYTNADVSDPVVRRMGKQLGWSDVAVKKAGGYITYQITGINDNRRVNTSYDGYAYGSTANQNRIRKQLSSMICMQHANRTVLAQLCLILYNPMDCNPPGSSVHGIFQT